MKKYISLFLFLSIFISLSVFSQDKGVTNVIVPGLDSLSRGMPIIMYDHTELTGNNKYIYLCGVLTEKEYYEFDDKTHFRFLSDVLYTPIFYKFSYENGYLNYIWQKKYNTGNVNKLDPEIPFKGVSFYYAGSSVKFNNIGKGTMYQNSSEGFDIISSASNYKEGLKKLLMLSFDSEGNLISETTNLDTNLLEHDYASVSSWPMPTYIRTKENKIYYMFQNGSYEGNKDPLNLYQGNWVPLEFDTIGNYIKKHSIFSFKELANNGKFKIRQGRDVYHSDEEIVFSDDEDNFYIFSNLYYYEIIVNEPICHIRDLLFVKLNKNLETEFYVFEKDITPDTTRDVISMSAVLDQENNVLLSLKTFDCEFYEKTYNLPPRDTIFYLTKLSGKTGEVIETKKIDMGKRILSMNVKVTNDGNTYIYGCTYPRNPYLAKIDNNLNIEWITTENIAMAESLTDFIDLEPGHFALVGLINNEEYSEPLIIEFSDNSGIDDGEKQIIFHYPNPTTDILNINNNYFLGEEYEIYDMSGNLIIKDINNTNQINVNKLCSGVYSLKIKGSIINFIKK